MKVFLKIRFDGNVLVLTFGKISFWRLQSTLFTFFWGGLHNWIYQRFLRGLLNFSRRYGLFFSSFRWLLNFCWFLEILLFFLWYLFLWRIAHSFVWWHFSLSCLFRFFCLLHSVVILQIRIIVWFKSIWNQSPKSHTIFMSLLEDFYFRLFLLFFCQICPI